MHALAAEINDQVEEAPVFLVLACLPSGWIPEAELGSTEHSGS